MIGFTGNNLSHKFIKKRSAKMDSRYLIERDGVWYLNYRMPKEFGGKVLRLSLKTDRIDVARRIRDQFLIPILYNSTVIDILQNMAKVITSLETEVIEQIENLESIINNNYHDLSLNACAERYFAFLEKSGKRPATIQAYKDIISKFTLFINSDKNINHLTKKDAILFRDFLQNAKLSSKRISNIFNGIRSFFKWCDAEGIITAPNFNQRFMIQLPVVRSEHTQLIPPNKADKAMRAKADWTIAPMIARYTGMRWMEIYRLCCGIGGNKIVEKHGIQCIYIDTDSKTHQSRTIPIAQKLLPYLTSTNMKEVANRNKEFNSKYNVELKKIEGCEECSFHSWRVYANTMMMEEGVDQAVRMAILGHATGDNIHVGYTATRVEQMKIAVDLIP